MSRNDGGGDVMRQSDEIDDDVMLRIEDSSYLRTIPEDSDDGSTRPRFQLPGNANSTAGSRNNNNAVMRSSGGGRGSVGVGVATQRRGVAPTPTGGAAILDYHNNSSMDMRPEEGGGGGHRRGGDAMSVVTDKATLAGENEGTLRLPRDGNRGPEQGRQMRRSLRVRWGGLSRRNQCIILFAIVLSALVVLAIILVVVFTTTGPPPSTPSPTTSPSPTPMVTPSPSTITQVDAVLYNVSNPIDFDDPASPQSQARNWLLYEDLLLYDVIADGDDHIAQRYICTELLYALQGININGTMLSDQSECDWFGFVCDNGVDEAHVVTRIEMNGTGLVGRLPSEISQLKVKRLELHNNSITGEIPSSWFAEDALQNLYYLDLSENFITGILDMNVWTTFPQLSYIYLNDNRLEGLLEEPPELDDIELPLVEFIWLQNNSLAGTFPRWILEHFPSLEELRLDWNLLTGKLPQDEDVATLTESIWPGNLTTLNLTANRFTGSIPSHLFFAPKLQNLILSNNSFSGTLPVTVPATLPSYLPDGWESPIRKVFLHSNLLTGVLPSDFGSLWRNLSKLTLHDNEFTGTISSELCSLWPMLTNLTADCLPNSTDITCACCSKCF